MKWVFWTFLSLMYVLLLIIGAEGKGRSGVRRDRAWKARKEECEQNTCSQYIIEESYNCVNQCTSPACFEEIYASNPLEEGEIDYDREREFVTCVRREQVAIQRQKNKASPEYD